MLGASAGTALAGITTTTSTTLVSTTSTTLVGTTTTTSTTVVGSTTSTTIPVCTDEATFDSISCRLNELSAAVNAASGDLGNLAGKLDGALGKAQNSTTLASEQCDAGDAKTAGKRLKKAIRRMIQFNHRLGSLKARKTVPDEVRQPLLDEGKAIQQDMQALKKALVCPPASPSGAFL
jgi:hypothetical protein